MKKSVLSLVLFIFVFIQKNELNAKWQMEKDFNVEELSLQKFRSNYMWKMSDRLLKVYNDVKKDTMVLSNNKNPKIYIILYKSKKGVRAYGTVNDIEVLFSIYFIEIKPDRRRIVISSFLLKEEIFLTFDLHIYKNQKDSFIYYDEKKFNLLEEKFLLVKFASRKKFFLSFCDWIYLF